MFRCLLWATVFRSKLLLIADNLCLRQQLSVLQRRKPRPRLRDADRCFWILACRWFVSWRMSLLIVKPEPVRRSCAGIAAVGEIIGAGVQYAEGARATAHMLRSSGAIGLRATRGRSADACRAYSRDWARYTCLGSDARDG
jgi:hypothetical protein